MQFFYIDEAEGPAISKFNDIYLLAMVVLDETKLRAVEDNLRQLAEDLFGQSRAGEIEFHGHEIYAGKGAFKGMTPQARIAIMEKIIALVPKHDLHVGYVVIDKPKYYGKRHPHFIAFTLLVEQIEDRLSRANTLGVLVADENDRMEDRLVLDLELFKTVSTSFGWRPTKIEHVADSIHFVRSKHNRLIQLADIMCTVILHGFCDEAELRASFLGEPDPQRKPPAMLWPHWRENVADRKQKANLALYTRLTAHFVCRKRFPRQK